MNTEQERIEKIALCLCGDAHNPKDHEALAEVIVEIVMKAEAELWLAVSREICRYNDIDPDSGFSPETKPVGWRPVSVLHGFYEAAGEAINLIRSGKC